ncbi:MAG: lipid-A-disaccharide synthase [Candidatus Marinimicrobia bacterium]|nr:lipid-A-disaccharide synthase [Candidatus Neomarinimicrobiota bacterium]
MSKLIFIIAGEASGDHHGALLMRHLKALDSDFSFLGIGGPQMESEGLRSLFSIQQMAVMGFIEIIRHLRFFKDVERKVLSTIAEMKPTRIILIDYPGFNLRIAQKIHNQFNIPITYYISPQIWAWKSGRIEIIRKCVDQMLVIFPFEKQWYADRGIDVEFVGHPMLDEWTPTSRETLCSVLGVSPDRPILTLYPGSRKNEIRQHLSVLLDAAQQIRNDIPDLQVIIGAAPGFSDSLPKGISLPDFVAIETHQPRLALEAADAAIVASGTSTVEAAIFGTPLVVMYKINYFSWLITRLLVKVQFAGMVNIISSEEVAPEFLQQDANVKSISKAVIRFFTDKTYTDTVKSKLLKVKESFGQVGASNRAAEAIVSAMKKQVI